MRGNSSIMFYQGQQPDVRDDALRTRSDPGDEKSVCRDDGESRHKKKHSRSATGPSEIYYSQLQAALCDGLDNDRSAFARLLVSRLGLTQVFRVLHTESKLSALGKMRGRWRGVTYSGELLAPSFATDTADILQTTSSPGASSVQQF